MQSMQQQLRDITTEIDAVNNPVEEEIPNTELDESLETVDENQEEVEEVNSEEVREEVEIRTLAELSEQIEVEPDYIYSLEIGMGAGNDPVKLGDLKDKYQQKLQQESLWLKEKEALTQQVQQTQHMQSTAQQISKDMQTALSTKLALEQQYNSTNWKELEETDPGQAALYQQKLQAAHGQVMAQYQQAEIQHQQVMQQAQQNALVQANQKLLQDIPEWNDATVRQTEVGDLTNTAKQFGFTDQDMSGISDPRVVMLLRRLTQLEKQAKISSEAVKRVQKAPKVLKGAGRKAPKVNNADQLIKKAKNAPRSVKRNAELDAVRAILGG